MTPVGQVLYNQIMRYLLLGLAIALAVTGAGAGKSQAQAPRVVAIADFVDESPDGALIQAPRLNATLERILAERGSGRLRVVSSGEVRAAMSAQGSTARDLVSPTKAIAVAQAVGAEWIVTGRWLHLDVDVFTLPSRTDPLVEIPVAIVADSLLELRVLEAKTRRIVLQDAFGGESRGVSRLGVLTQAARIALQRAADRLLTL